MTVDRTKSKSVECLFLKQLTARELEVLSLLADGYTNSAIAGTLGMNIEIVEHHLNSMYSKVRMEKAHS